MTAATLFFALIVVQAGDFAGPAAERPTGPVVLDFTATWCGPCRQMRPAVEQLIAKGYPIKPVDIDRSPETAERYEVTGVPTFVAIDPATGKELGRVSGARPATDIAALYRKSAEALKAAAGQDGEEPRARAVAASDDEPADDGPEPTPAPKAKPNPDPWATVVRIKVHGQGSIGFGSGTIISSTPKEALILTCAHIFKLEGKRQAPPSKFPRRITIDLFDGKLQGVKPATVHYTNETYEGEAVDYDFAHDVGLIRIRPGRRLPYAKVVPPHWTPKARMEMITVGCSEGHDATAWRTNIVNPKMRGNFGNGAYDAIECTHAPKQGRSGGGLFTSDGYVAGVCDFAEPHGDHGLYAAPTSIYGMLDRNNLVALYDPSRRPGVDASETLVADRGAGRDRGARMQSPEPDAGGSVSLPPHEMFGIKTPAVPASNRKLAAAEPTRKSWHAGTTDLKLSPSLDTDKFSGSASPSPVPVSNPEDEPESTLTSPQGADSPNPVDRDEPRPRPAAGKWRAVRSATSDGTSRELANAGAK